MINQSLAAALLAMRKADQEMRMQVLRDPEAEDSTLDRRHTAKLKQIVQEYAWPSISLVGNEAAEAAWLIVQHADLDVAFQEQCLALMKALPEGEVSLTDIAYLEDRVLTNKGQPQLYGTQFQGRGKRLKPQPIKDEGQLDTRRRQMGLEPFENYRRVMLDIYGT